MTPDTELDRLFTDIPKPEAPIPLPDVIDCSGVTICNDDIACERSEPNPDGANTLPVYPKPDDLEVER